MHSVHRRVAAAPSFTVKQLIASSHPSPSSSSSSSSLPLLFRSSWHNSPAARSIARITAAKRTTLHSGQRGYATKHNDNSAAAAMKNLSSTTEQSPPPTTLPNMPREDYATPAMYTFGIMGRLFRYSIYASVILALGGTSLYLSVQAYVEYIALHGWSPISLSDDEAAIFPIDDLVPAYSGAHLGGGTDPAIGWKARFAARGAWIALNLRQGGVVAGTKGRMSDVAVPDKAWLEAERYLVYALEQCDLTSSVSDNDKTASAKSHWELLTRLAEVRSKLAGPRGLGDARRNYQQLIMEMRESAMSSEPLVVARLLECETRLAEVELRIVRELMTSKAAQDSTEAARQGALSRLLIAIQGAASGRSHKAALSITPPSASVETPASASWFSTGVATISKHPATSTVDDLCRRLTSILDSQTPSSVAPVVQRSLAASLVTLTSSLATSANLPTARAVSTSALAWLERTQGRDDGAPSESSRLHRHWLATRLATLRVYAAEIVHGSHSSMSQPNDQSPLMLLDGAASICDALLQDPPSAPKVPLFSTTMPHHIPHEQIHFSASRTGALASYTRAILLEQSPDAYRQALQAHERALAFLTAQTSNEEVTTLRVRIVDGIRRCRERLLVA